MKKRMGPGAVIALLGVILIGTILVSAVLGRYPIGLKEFFGILGAKLAPIAPFWSKTQEALLLNHRLPRVILACLVGGCLSAAGASYQGVFQNPMASPDILGASAGAGFGAALAIFLGLGPVWVMVFAFGGSLITVAAAIFAGSRGKGSLGLILAGIMVGSLASSGTSFIKLVADPEDQLPAITYWLMGSLNGTESKDVLFGLLPMALGLAGLFLLRWKVNLLAMGDEEARTLGIRPKALRLWVILCSTLITAASVAVSGVIGWVGLVVPHLARRLVGSNFKHLMPAATILGAIFLLLVDDVSRNLLTTEIPMGILTAMIGAPFFIFLMGKEGRL